MQHSLRDLRVVAVTEEKEKLTAHFNILVFLAMHVTAE